MEFFEILFNLDVKTMIGVLFWGNLALAFLILRYYLNHRLDRDKILMQGFGIAKILQAVAWILLFLRGNIHDIISVYFGNVLLFVGFYLDSLVILKMNKKTEKIWMILQSVLLGVSIISFILLEILIGTGNVRIAMASLSVFCIFVIPNVLNTIDKSSSRFQKFIGIINLLFVLLLLIRAITSLLNKEVNLHTNNILQSVTFILLILLMFVNGIGFLLIMYERSYERLRESSNLDPLTQINNRRYFMAKAEAYYHRAVGEQTPLSFLFIDIDFFKKVNDTYGHLFGDEVLKTVAKTIYENVRPLDLCCRFGGEEFLILAHETNGEQAVIMGNRIREIIQNLVFEENRQFKCTVSVGIYSGLANSEQNIQNFIDNADQALYKAKKSGRNCVVSF
ncbi:MAG TPA: GGDEF domain-containing protein [Erysipelotrichaceae bacterium]|nr:GGDEF domain-containing protein [Erysipelotrichaceae bacterium]